MPKMPDHIHMMVHGEVSSPPIATLLGFTLTSVGDGEAVIEFEAAARHANPMGTLHGGVLCDIADAAMGMAYASTLAEEETFTTLELKINFLKPVWTARLLASGRVVKAGKTIGPRPRSRAAIETFAEPLIHIETARLKARRQKVPWGDLQRLPILLMKDHRHIVVCPPNLYYRHRLSLL
jgi:uncharacterized protein (TIGR00369 family)